MNQQQSTLSVKPLIPAKELAAMVKRLPRDERLRLEGVITGMELAQNGRHPVTDKDSA